MMRKRLRPMPTDEQLVEMYAKPHRHADYKDHLLRVDVTSALAHNLVLEGQTVADLSCGDAVIPLRLHESHGVRLILGDIAPGYPHHGPIQQTVAQLAPGEVDLFICSETLEHLDDPDKVLRLIREKARMLLLTTPEGEQNNANPQHLWGWDSEAVREMLTAAGFTPVTYNLLDLRLAGGTYAYQMWACR